MTGTSAAAAIIAAFSKFRLPCCSFFSELLLSLITFNATNAFFCLASFITKARLTKSSIVSGLATGIRICSLFICLASSSACTFSSKAKRRAERSVTKELMTQVKSIITTVPFNTSSFNKRSPFSIIISWPINTAASVAAACALLKPNIMLRSFDCIRYIFCVIQAANHLLKVATTVITTATFNASPPVNRLLTSIIIPTPIRK